MIQVILLHSGRLNSRICDTLLHAAWQLARSEDTESHFSDDYCEGFVSTSYNSVQMAGSGGIEFTAEVSWGDQTAKATFMVRSRLLQDTNPPRMVWGVPVFRRRSVRPELLN